MGRERCGTADASRRVLGKVEEEEKKKITAKRERKTQTK
jgi:hypothetical protein